jgi:hypothetical protein
VAELRCRRTFSLPVRRCEGPCAIHHRQSQLASFRKIDRPASSPHDRSFRNLPSHFPFGALVIGRASPPPYSGDEGCCFRTDEFRPAHPSRELPDDRTRRFSVEIRPFQPAFFGGQSFDFFVKCSEEQLLTRELRSDPKLPRGLVVVAGRREVEGEETVELLRAAGGDGLFVKADVSKSAEVEALIQKAVEKFSRCFCAAEAGEIPRALQSRAPAQLAGRPYASGICGATQVGNRKG